jgi:signal transduction histidine kinase
MRETVKTLLEFRSTASRAQEAVDLTELVRELTRACSEKLESRGVRLVVEAGEEVAPVRGSREQLRQMMEHLLNNAAQALARVSATRAEQEEQVIRVSVSADGERVHFVVSDTGPGFAQPGRVFEPSDSTGLGLSLCYGIVREHGGEISAFNLQPHGAAVAVELPRFGSEVKKSGPAAGEEIYSASI